MCTAGSALAGDAPFGSASGALRLAGAALDYLNSPGAAPAGSFCGELLIALGEMQAKLTAAHAAALRRSDAHDADGYGSSSSWLAAKAGMSKQGARAAVRQMRQLTERPLLGAALAAGDITDSLAFTVAGWTRKLPPEMRTGTDRILLDAAAAGASPDDLATIAGCAIERWRQQQPGPDDPDDGFDDRGLQLGTTFGGAAVLRGDLTPECATAVRAVLEALGKKAGPEDDRTEHKRFHDALQLACTSQPRVWRGEAAAAVGAAMAAGPAPPGMGAEVPGPGRDQPHHRDRVTDWRWNRGTSASLGSPWRQAGGTGSRWPEGTRCPPMEWGAARAAMWTCSPAGSGEGSSPNWPLPLSPRSRRPGTRHRSGCQGGTRPLCDRVPGLLIPWPLALSFPRRQEQYIRGVCLPDGM
jgi:hypothetical protein